MSGGSPAIVVVPVIVEFLLGGGPHPAIPPLDDPRPLWLPADFAFRYTYPYSTGSVVIDLEHYSREGAAPQAQARLDFPLAERESIYLALFKAAAFSVPAETARALVAGVLKETDGYQVTVVGTFPTVGPPFAPHRLDLWHYGLWRRITWRAARPDAEDLATVGALIRRLVAEKPAVSELPRELQKCLEP